jgi:hypothetical protein
MEHRDGKDMIWWRGVVEDRKDPLKLGRVRVRIFGWHSDKKEDLPTDELPWAYPTLPLDHMQNVVGPREGDWAYGFFGDGIQAQRPIITGIYSGIPEDEAKPKKAFFDPRIDELVGHQVPGPVASTTQHDDGSGTDIDETNQKPNYPDPDFLDEPSSSRFQRNEKIADTIVQEKRANVDIGQRSIPTSDHPAGTGTDVSSPSGEFYEEETPYDAEYPYNHAWRSEGEHLFEMDDTPGKERIHLYHRTGTFEEVHPSGLTIKKIVQGFTQIILKSWWVHVEAFALHTVDKGMKLFVNKDAETGNNYDLTVGENGDLNLTVLAGKLNIHVKDKDINCKTERHFNLEVDENWNITIHGDVNMLVEGDYNLHVKEDMSTIVDGNYNLFVGVNQTVVVQGNDTLVVEGDKAAIVYGNDTMIVEGEKGTVVGGDETTGVAGSSILGCASRTEASVGENIRAAGGAIGDVSLISCQRIAPTLIADFAPLISHTGALTSCSGALEGGMTDSNGDTTLPGAPAIPGFSIDAPGIDALIAIASGAAAVSAASNPANDNIEDAIAEIQALAEAEAEAFLSASTGFGAGGDGSGSGSGSGSHEPGLPVAAPIGFLWKPQSDSDGNLAVLLEPGAGGPCTVNGTSGRDAGVANGNRQHYRYSQPGGAFGMNISVVYSSGTVIIPDGSLRYEGAGWGFTGAPEVEPPVE